MMLPPLTKERFDRLLALVRPPACECRWAVSANNNYELTQEQREKLVEAVNEAFRYNTGTMTQEEKKAIAIANRDATLIATSEHGWGWRPRSFGKNI